MDNKRKMREGIVTSDKMEKTAIVTESISYLHPVYKKRVSKRKKYVADNPNNDAKAGDTVRIYETRPLSKTKRWRISEVLKRGD